MGATGHSRMQCDPPDVAAHDLDDHAPVVGLRRCAEPVDGLGRDGMGRVEAEGVVGAAEIVVDGLRDADDVQTLFVHESGGTGQSSLAADRNDRVDAVGAHHLTHPLRPAALIGVGARSAEDGAAAAGESTNVEHRHVEHIVFEQAAPPVADSDERILVGANALADDSADDRVESGAVTAGGQYTYLHSNCP